MKYRLALCLTILFAIIAFSGCLSESDQTGQFVRSQEELIPPSDFQGVSKIEVYHFHSSRQCYSCIRLGELAEETVKAYFPKELESGKIVFGHINIDLEDNREIVGRYGARGSSLYIGTYYGDGAFKKEENIQVWYKIGDPEDYKSYLGELINRKFVGA
jgi:thiol-disulfide isomerase/thioredoxin